MRSSRRLERECKRNIELQWLLNRLVPNYHSIADFRKDNPTALRNTFKLFLCFLKDLDLIGGKTVAIDGTKMLAHYKIKYELLGKQMEGSRSPQVSTTDPDARALLVQGQVVEVSYNMQAAVDDKHKLVVRT